MLRPGFALALLFTLVPGCDLLTALNPPPVDDGNGRPRGNDDDCDEDEDCRGGEFCDDGECRDFDESEGEGEGPAEGEGEGPPPPPPPCGDSGCPEILSLSANRSRLTEFDTATISAVVTDPDGVADVIAGVLFDPTSNDVYGNFASTSPGAYQIAVSWGLLNPVRSIDFTGQTTRVVRARFLDQSGNEAQGDVTLTLACTDDDVACDGECGAERCGGACLSPEELSSRDNCGSCGNVCDDGAICERGRTGEFECICPDGDCAPAEPGVPYRGSPENGVRCNDDICTDACCVNPFDFTAACASAGSCPFGGATCDGPEDCGFGEECCFDNFGASCVDDGTCRAAGNREVCINDGDCESGELCCTSSLVTAVGADGGVCALEAEGGGCPQL